MNDDAAPLLEMGRMEKRIQALEAHERLPQQVIFKFDGGAFIPSWLAGLAGLIVLCSLLSLLVTVLIAGPRLDTLAREIRILQLHTQDVESVLKEHGLATTRDFAGWGDSTGPSHRTPTKER